MSVLILRSFTCICNVFDVSTGGKPGKCAFQKLLKLQRNTYQIAERGLIISDSDTHLVAVGHCHISSAQKGLQTYVILTPELFHNHNHVTAIQFNILETTSKLCI